MSIDRHGSTNAVPSEDDALFLDILHEAPLFGQRKPTSIGGSILFCILLAGYATLAVATPWIFHPVQALISPLLCSCNVIMLVFTGIFQQYMVYQVQKIRLQGYYVFSQKLKHLVRLPFATTAYGTAAMLLVIVWKPHIFLSISVLLRIIMLIEVVCAGFFMGIYIGSLKLRSNKLSPGRLPGQGSSGVKGNTQINIPMPRDDEWKLLDCGYLVPAGYIHKYNSLDSQPDVLKSLYSPLQQSSPLEGLRYHDGRLADQQMALLQYQRENLHFLSEEILRLQECLSKYERSNDGITPQVDLAHLLATRDQELRTLSAEMNQLQSELRLARSLIAERDSEILRVRTTNNQYIEENERLRAILGEWSTRAAKLERALESERMSNMELQKKILQVRNHQRAQESTGPT